MQQRPMTRVCCTLFVIDEVSMHTVFELNSSQIIILMGLNICVESHLVLL